MKYSKNFAKFLIYRINTFMIHPPGLQVYLDKIFCLREELSLVQVPLVGEWGEELVSAEIFSLRDPFLA